MTFTHPRASIGELKALFSTLPQPSRALFRGFFRATFIGPAWIRIAARPSLEVSGLPGWQGKRFLDDEHATNVLTKGATTREHLAMRVTAVTSRVDGRPGVALTYPHRGRERAPIPWRWVRDELRQFDDDTILAMTVVDLPVLRRFALPFLLVREA